MKTTIAETLALGTLVVGAWQALAQDAKAPYPNMAPLDQYLMADRNAEIALAQSAAPEGISRDAEVAVLDRHGYETAIKGKNGFVCLVERSWMSPFDSPEFWNPKLRGPICFNPPAARSVLPLTFKRTDLVLAGLSKAQIIDGIKKFDKNELPALEPGGMTYMMSSQAYLADDGGHWVPHLMFYVPQTDGMTWGADVTRSPVLLSPQFHGAPEPITVFMIPVLTWSDGKAAPAHAPQAQREHGCANVKTEVIKGSVHYVADEQPYIVAELVEQYGTEARVKSTPEMEQASAALRGAYAAFNRGDIDAAVEPLDAQIKWTEPAEFPGGGTYHGREGVKLYLTQSRAAWAEVSSEPERFITADNRIVVFVHARVRPKDSDNWQEVNLADVYTVRNGTVVEMQAFADQQEALRWAGAKEPGR